MVTLQNVLRNLKLVARMLVFSQKTLALMDWSAVSSSHGNLCPGPLLFLTLTYQPDQSDCEIQQVSHAACSLNTPSQFPYLIKHEKEDQCCWSQVGWHWPVRLTTFLWVKVMATFLPFQSLRVEDCRSPNSKGRDESWLSQCLTLPFWLLVIHWRLLDEVLTIQRETLQNHQIALHNG